VDKPGDLIESILRMTGWTQSRLAYELRGVARSLHEPEPTGLQTVTVNRWRRGRQKPGGYYWRLLQLLHARICGQLAGENHDWTEDGDEMKRRQFFAYAAVLAGTVALDPERLTAAWEKGAGTDRRLVDHLGASIAGHARRWHVDRADLLLPTVRSELTTVNELRITSTAPAIRRRLTSLSSASAALAGWLAWHVGNDEAANAYYTLAYSLASDVQDRDGRAFVLVLRSFMNSSLFGAKVTDDSRPLRMLQEAVELTERSMSPFLRSFALRRRAEEQARAGGQKTAIERDLDRAQSLLASASGPDEGFYNYCNEDRVIGCRGTCALAQGRARDAISLLSTVLSATPADLAAERSILVADMGAAHAMLGDVDQACNLLSRSLEMGGHGITNRIGRVRILRSAHLSRWSKARPVAQLDDELRTIASGLTG
jgi:hypothetical protein